jgi:hypothetical protein
MTLALPDYEGSPGRINRADVAVPGSGLIEWAAKADAAARIARGLAGTSFVPESLRIRDATTGQLDLDLTVMQVTAALLKGEELALPPMASLGAIDVIPPGSGVPALRGAALGALLHQHGHHYWVVEQNASRCTLRGRRRDALPDEPDAEARWDTDRARNLVGPQKMNDPRGNWKRQPATMLYWRALADLTRQIAPEVMLGLPMLAEEAGDEPDDEPGQNGQRPAGGKGRSRGAPAARTPAAGPTPVAPGGGGEGAAQGSPAPAMITEPQRRKLWAGMGRLGITGREPSLRMVSQWVGRDVASSNDLTEAEASKVLDAIKSAEDQLAVRAAQDQAGEGAQEPGRQEPVPDPPPPDEPDEAP